MLLSHSAQTLIFIQARWNGKEFIATYLNCPAKPLKLLIFAKESQHFYFTLAQLLIWKHHRKPTRFQARCGIYILYCSTTGSTNRKGFSLKYPGSFISNMQACIEAWNTWLLDICWANGCCKACGQSDWLKTHLVWLQFANCCAAFSQFFFFFCIVLINTCSWDVRAYFYS